MDTLPPPTSLSDSPLTGKHIVVAGGSGLIGRALTAFLTSQGATPLVISRQPQAGQHGWEALPALLEQAWGVVNLCGENVATGRWSPQRKKRLWDSRMDSTRRLVKAIQASSHTPQVMVQGSAIGLYGPHRGATPLHESTPPGKGFLGDLCVAWEAAAEAVQSAPVRLVKLRTGLVISPEGGFFPPLKRIAQWGAACPLGEGDQYMSWIHIQDWVRLMGLALTSDACQGPLNATAPLPVSHYTFMQTLTGLLHRPLWDIPNFLSRFGVELFLGEKGKTLLLEGACVVPRQAERHGFVFHYPQLQGALQAILREDPPFAQLALLCYQSR